MTPLRSAHRRRFLILACAAGAAVILLITLRRRDPPSEYFLRETVHRGEIHRVLREAGTLVPREAVLVKCPFNAALQFIVDDGTWIDKGGKLFTLTDDEELKRVADDRSRLLGLRQELRLARMRRANAGQTEDRKLAAAKRARELEGVRYRIITATPAGGGELIRLHEKLLPHEAETAKVRLRYEDAQDSYQTAFDAHLDALDALQASRDSALRAQARVDELSAAAATAPENLKAEEREQREQALKGLATARAELDALQTAIPELAKKLIAARESRDRAKEPRDQAAQELAAREADEREDLIRIEIEKRGVQAELLRLDEESKRIGLAESERKRDQGRLGFADGALSRSALDDLEAQAESAKSQLGIVTEKLAIAERPAAPEALAEAKMKLDIADARAERAQLAHDRALAILDKEVDVLVARVDGLGGAIDQRSSRFPALIESNIDFARKELAALEEDAREGGTAEDAKRRAEVEAEIARMVEQLATAKEDPPNSAKAPVSGIVKVKWDDEGGRPKQGGDKVYEEDVLIEIFPPENLEVVAKVNEANISLLAVGMPAEVEFPSLGNGRCSGEIYRVSGVGRDKFADYNDGWNKASFADVTQYEVRCRLGETRADFRQGMTAMVSVRLDARKDALWLPLGAVTRAGDAWTALVGDDRSQSVRTITGEPYGDDAFIVAGGLAEGDTVLCRRTRNR